MEFGVIGSPFCEHASFCHDFARNVNAESCESGLETDGHIFSIIFLFSHSLCFYFFQFCTTLCPRHPRVAHWLLSTRFFTRLSRSFHVKRCVGSLKNKLQCHGVQLIFFIQFNFKNSFFKSFCDLFLQTDAKNLQTDLRNESQKHTCCSGMIYSIK
jgi:hypothetical protein